MPTTRKQDRDFDEIFEPIACDACLEEGTETVAESCAYCNSCDRDLCEEHLGNGVNLDLDICQSCLETKGIPEDMLKYCDQETVKKYSKTKKRGEK